MWKNANNNTPENGQIITAILLNEKVITGKVNNGYIDVDGVLYNINDVVCYKRYRGAPINFYQMREDLLDEQKRTL